jgi:hypothetical protein
VGGCEGEVFEVKCRGDIKLNGDLVMCVFDHLT